ncbi:MAG: hypothetical protein V1908_04630 [Candidatus Peregrinibacteria bacterium]
MAQSFETLQATSGQEAVERIQAMIDAGLRAQVRLIVTTRQALEDVGLAQLNPYNLTTVPGQTEERTGGITTIRIKIGMVPLRNTDLLVENLQKVIDNEGMVTVEQKPGDTPLTSPILPAIATGKAPRTARARCAPRAHRTITDPAPSPSPAPPAPKPEPTPKPAPAPAPAPASPAPAADDSSPSPTPPAEPAPSATHAPEDPIREASRARVVQLQAILASGRQPRIEIDSPESLEAIKTRLEDAGWSVTLFPPEKKTCPEHCVDRTTWGIEAILQQKGARSLPDVNAVQEILYDLISRTEREEKKATRINIKVIGERGR